MTRNDLTPHQPNVIPQLDGLRAFAALLVVFSHTIKVGLPLVFPSLTGGFGVMLFFMLSGFLMGYLYLHKPLDIPAAAHYISARVARIAPIYLVVVTLTFCASKLIGPDFVYYIKGHDFFRLLAFSGSNYVFWSIPPEIQFYVVFLGVWCALRLGLLVAAAPLTILLCGIVIVARPVFPGISVPSHFHIFFLGVALAVFVRTNHMRYFSPTVAGIVQACSLVALLLASTGILPSAAFVKSIGWDDNAVFYGNIGIALCFGAFLLASTIPNRFGNLIFANRAMRKIGNYSFSLYLLHEPILAGTHNVLSLIRVPEHLQIVVGVCLSVAVAALSFHIFERPAQDLLRVPVAKAIASFLGRVRMANPKPVQ